MGKFEKAKNGSAPSELSAKQRFEAVCAWIYKLRSVILAVPVVIAAVILAVRNLRLLPDAVGLELMANGEFSNTVSKGVAVMGPLALTAVCLLLMFCSKKVVYPWLISVFSLVLPLLILLLNTFSG